MLLHVLTAGGGELHGDKLVALLLEAGDDFSDEAALDAIGLDHDVCSAYVEEEHRSWLASK